MNKFLEGVLGKLSTSAGGKLDLTDVGKLVRNAGIVGVGAALAYMVGNVGNIDIGSATMVVVPVCTFLLDAVYRYFKDNVKVEE